jgi:Kelch motif
MADVRSDPGRSGQARPRPRVSGARRRGLVRLVVLVVLVGWLVVLGAKGVFSGGKSKPAAATASHGPAPTRPPSATTAPMRLPQPLHGATAAVSGGRLLVIGGADRADVSTDGVQALDPRGGKASSEGTLAQALHDAAATSLGGRTLVFGGGASTTYDLAQELSPGGSAHQIGHLPVALSDLSAVSVGDRAYVLGGYDGRQASAAVYRTSDGTSFTTVARLPTAVRYTAVAPLGTRIYAFGGELSTGADTNTIQELDTATGRASVAGHLSEPVAHASAVVLNGIIYVLGGRRNGIASDRILRFDPSRHSLVPAGRLPAPVFDAAAGTVSGVAYLAGGIGASGTSVDSVVELSENP